MTRKLERTPVALDVTLEWTSGKREARVSDLSLGGCFVDCIAQIPEGEKVSFKIKVPDGDWIELRGEITYALPGFGFGVRFAPLSEADRIILEHLILMNDGDPWKGDEPRSAE